jgi:hypothetical protein
VQSALHLVEHCDVIVHRQARQVIETFDGVINSRIPGRDPKVCRGICVGRRYGA